MAYLSQQQSFYPKILGSGCFSPSLIPTILFGLLRVMSSETAANNIYLSQGQVKEPLGCRHQIPHHCIIMTNHYQSQEQISKTTSGCTNQICYRTSGCLHITQNTLVEESGSVDRHPHDFSEPHHLL